MVKLVVRASLAAPRDALTSSIFEDAESAAWVMGDQLQISVMIFLYHVFFVLKNMYLFIYLCIYIYIYHLRIISENMLVLFGIT